MAKIGRSDSAPEGDFVVSFAVGTVDTSGGDFDTNDPRLVAEAASHPWLKVTDYNFKSEEKGQASVVGTSEAERNPEASKTTSAPEGDSKERRSFRN